MTMEELKDRWMEYIAYLDRIVSIEDVNDFCSINATSYEEYMAIYELLEDWLEGFKDMPEYNR